MDRGFSLKHLKEQNHLEDLHIYQRITTKRTGMAWPAFICFRTGTSTELL